MLHKETQGNSEMRTTRLTNSMSDNVSLGFTLSARGYKHLNNTNAGNTFLKKINDCGKFPIDF